MRSFVLLSIVVLGLPAQAIVRRHDVPDSRYREAARGLDAVVDMNLPGGAGTLIAPEWVLTAAHVTVLFKSPHEVIVGGERVAVKRVVAYPGGREGRHDLALVQLARAVTNVAPLPLYEKRDEEGATITVAGRGFSGDGLQGPVERDRVFRAATNRIDRVLESWLVFRFDAPPEGTALEGISGPGDSGGPALLTVDGKVFVAGVSSGQDDRGQGKEGVYGVDEYYVRVSSYLEWIAQSSAHTPRGTTGAPPAGRHGRQR